MHKYHPESEHKYARILADSATTIANQSVATFLYAPSDTQGEAMAMGLDVATHIERFRALRLFHYMEALRFTKSIKEAQAQMERLNTGKACDRPARDRLSDRVSLFSALHGGHMTSVQTLNILFPVGDNVEGDMPA